VGNLLYILTIYYVNYKQLFDPKDNATPKRIKIHNFVKYTSLLYGLLHFIPLQTSCVKLPITQNPTFHMDGHINYIYSDIFHRATDKQDNILPRIGIIITAL